jgi:5-oxoprolinase (ATP-hydrolysing) subunit A
MERSLAVDLNCDLGEGFGRYDLGSDAAMMRWITSANVACGFHAGDPQVMARTAALAREHGVALGAHPGYPDLQGFGRRAMALSAEALKSAIHYQLGALEAIARVAGTTLVHVKPHGALYNLAATDEPTAQTVASAVAVCGPQLVLVGLAGSALVRAGIEVGLRVANEGFPDRAYLPDGQLMPRSQAGALITDPEKVAENALRLVREGIFIEDKHIKIDTLCLHGDNAAAVENAQEVRLALEQAGVQVCPLLQVLTLT